LTEFNLDRTGIFRDRTGIFRDKEAFVEYRKSNGLKFCDITFTNKVDKVVDESALLKEHMDIKIFNKLVKGRRIVKDWRGHITKVKVKSVQCCPRSPFELDSDELQSLQFDIQVLQGLQHLTSFNLQNTRVTGDIRVLQGFRNLTTFKLYQTGGVKGDIAVLPELINLTKFTIAYTGGVKGDIAVLKSLPNLTEFELYDTNVTGNIQVLQELRNLTKCHLGKPHVTGDKEAFQNYRKSHGLKECQVWL